MQTVVEDCSPATLAASWVASVINLWASPQAVGLRAYIDLCGSYILPPMAKHLVDIDDAALRAARAQLGTDTIKDTVNGSLRRVGKTRSAAVKRSLDRLARAELDRREDAWR